MSETYILSNSKSSLFRNRQRFSLFLFIYFVIMLLPAYWLDVFETTDARYAEIAREMIASGNYLEPFYNGIKHFHKPPFTYWITALGLHIFGINGLGARFFGAVAAVITLIYVRKLALVLTDDEETADNSVMILGSSALFMIVGRIVATDIYLTCFTVIALYHLFNQIYGVKSIKNTVFMSLAFGLGFLTKGPIIFLFTLLPFFAAKIFSREHRRVFSLKEILAGTAVFLAVALPWYIYVISVNDGLLNYFLYDQTVERVASEKFNRSQPLHFLPMIFVVTLFPFIINFFKNIGDSGFVRSGRSLYLYILLPFIVFEMSTSKLPSYILPFYPAAAVLAAGNLKGGVLSRFIGYLFLAVALIMGTAPFVLGFLKPFSPYIATGAVILALFFAVLVFKKYYEKHYSIAVAVSMVLVTLLAYSALTFVGDYFKGYRLIAQDIREFDPQGQYPVVTFLNSAPSLSFYLNDVKPALKGKTRETGFQSEEEIEKVYMDSWETITEYFNNSGSVIVVTNKEHFENLENKSGKKCRIISRRGERRIVCLCE